MKDKVVFKKNQDIHLTIEDFTREGEGLGKVHGFPFFVKDTVIGDVAVVTVSDNAVKHLKYYVNAFDSSN